MKKLLIILSILTAILALTCKILSNKLEQKNIEINRLEENQDSLLGDLNEITLLNKQSAVETKALKLELSELKDSDAKLSLQVANLTGKLKEVNRIEKATVNLNLDTIIKIQNVYLRDTVYQCAEYIDSHNTFISCIDEIGRAHV